MEYTVHKLSQMAGISGRTLRYYDEIGILSPARINSSGYRIYGQAEVDRLQQILFYRELGLELEAIKEIINSPSFDRAGALREHRHKLVDKRTHLDLLIDNVDKTLASIEGGIVMSDQDKFVGFKQKLIADNEEKYGREIRAKYGNETIDRSNQKVMNMTEDEYAAANQLASDIINTLHKAMAAGDPAGETAQQAAALHRQWLSLYWDNYSPQAHLGVTQMYVADDRFRAYYDREQPGTAEFLRKAVSIYVDSLTKNS